VGACVATQGLSAVRWGGFRDGHIDGVLGVLVGLAISPLLDAGIGCLVCKAAWRMLRRARRRVAVAARAGEWGTAAALAFSHGANDAQKTMGVITLLLVATGHLHVPGAAVGQAHGGGVADGRYVAGWVADRQDGGSRHLPVASPGWARQPRRLSNSDLRCGGGRCAGEHHTRGVSQRGWRRCRTARASRAMGGSR
jgi:phosphate/sulfate permease